MKRLFVLLCACVVFLSGCSIVANIEELIEAPKLNEMQDEIYAALYRGIGTKNILRSYPMVGSNRTSVILKDIDGDAIQEALVFYQRLDIPSENTFVSVLKNSDEKWFLFDTLEGLGNQVELVFFANLSVQGETLVGWENSVTGTKVFGIYVMGEDALSLRESQEYEYLASGDLDGDSFDELINIVNDGWGLGFLAKMISYNPEGDIYSYADSVRLNSFFSECTSILKARVDNGRTVFCITGKTGANMIANEVIYVEENRLLKLGEDNLLFDLTSRGEDSPGARDIDGDGNIDFPGREEGKETQWYTFVAGQIKPLLKTYTNTKYRFMVVKEVVGLRNMNIIESSDGKSMNITLEVPVEVPVAATPPDDGEGETEVVEQFETVDVATLYIQNRTQDEDDLLVGVVYLGETSLYRYYVFLRDEGDNIDIATLRMMFFIY